MVQRDAAAAATSNRLTTLGLHVLLAQLQPLLAGFEITDASQRKRKHVQDDEQDVVEAGLFSSSNSSSGGLRICSSEVASIVRDICFPGDGTSSVGRLPASRRVGYTKATRQFVCYGGAQKQRESKMPQLSEVPSVTQAYLLLLLEHKSDIFNKAFYAVSSLFELRRTGGPLIFPNFPIARFRVLV